MLSNAYYNPKKRSLEDEQDSSPKKRRAQLHAQSQSHSPNGVIDLTRDSPEPYTIPPISPNRAEEEEVQGESAEKLFGEIVSGDYTTACWMFVISRNRTETADITEENVDIVGTTGNIYTVTITHEPRCTCPDALKGNQCKHIIYVLVNVLKAHDELRYQLAFLSSELREMYDKAPIETEEAHTDTDASGKRKPIEGDCPICFMEFEPDKEKIVWCKRSCGNNIHKTCFDQWTATTRDRGVRCVLCRTEWSTDPGATLDRNSLMSRAEYGEDGYMNVASAVGLSGHRDYSTYHRYWVDRHLGRRRGRSSYYFDDD
ncbi:RING finger domain protein (Znf1), putative [Talaromyces stipitatus ATCC 10500]|uniref:RING finger domain protein (Znf1), putative n=1 Tax=Talaromyces stipitatus (strain ATCC 10500 / CBS 375.48 / QM 6759 / NRRL 1006) TaxID=441959 RepID=B8LUC5_TALSN|nr:RING finger domain protein (Znf1), putative [Talaromyces stipitatus ATCC 10500]EED23698.1 RING finger domain protein (Znf1), putative [Talaromyces stipitatus ATCC 10500]